jgi:hypothetical protein
MNEQLEPKPTGSIWARGLKTLMAPPTSWPAVLLAVGLFQFAWT